MVHRTTESSPQGTKRQKLASRMGLLGLTASLALGMTSCSNKATEEQMKLLGDLDRQRDALRMELDRANSGLRDARSKLAQQEKELADCGAESASVREMLTRWPNVWADSVEWRVAPPVTAPVEPVKKTSKKK